MKKIIALFMTFMFASIFMTVISVNAYARNWIISPIASTYTTTETTKKHTEVDHNNEHGNITEHYSRPQDNTEHSYFTRPNTTNSEKGSSTPNNNVSTNTDKSDRHVTGRTTYRKTEKNNYDNNSGKDDPDSPNYTGKREIQSDKNLTSPDTASENKHDVIFVLIPIAVVVIVCIIVIV